MTHAHDENCGTWDARGLFRALASHGLGAAQAGGFGPRARARRGDTRSAILRVLSEQPMHGYQIIQEISRRSDGVWRPSAGSIYPTLQLLADEGLVTSSEEGGKKVFSLTDEGREAAGDLSEDSAPWDVAAAVGDHIGLIALRQAGGRLASAVVQVARSGDKEGIDAAVEILNSARKQVYALLAKN